MHPAVPAADAGHLSIFLSRVHSVHQAPLLPAPAEEEHLRNWLVGQARLSLRVAAELADELYRHQAVENLDDLREFSELPEFKKQFKGKDPSTFIVKPAHDCQGRGIYLMRSFEDLQDPE